MPEIVAAAATAFSGVDNMTVLNGAQGISEIMNQVIGQAGPALAMARQSLGQDVNGKAANGAAPADAEDETPPRKRRP